MAFAAATWLPRRPADSPGPGGWAAGRQHRADGPPGLLQVSHGLTAATPVENPHCSCKAASRASFRCLQLQSLLRSLLQL